MDLRIEHNSRTRSRYLFIALALALVFPFLPLVQGAERYLYDCRVGLYRILHPASRLPIERLVMVNIDDATLDTLGEFPLSYSHYAKFLQVARKGGARAVVFTFSLVESRAGRQGVESFMREMDSGPATYLTYYFERSLDGNDDIREALPREPLVSHMMAAGFVYPETESDGIMRHKLLLKRLRSSYHPSLEVITASLILGVSPKRIEVENSLLSFLERDVPMGDNYTYSFIPMSKGVFTSVPFMDFVSGAGRPDVKGKVLLVGVSSARAARQYRVPGAAAFTQPYHYTLAATALDMVNGNAVREVPLLISLLLALLMGALMGLHAPGLKGGRLVRYTAKLVACAVFVNLVAFLLGCSFLLFNLVGAPVVFAGMLEVRRQYLYRRHLSKFVPGRVLEFLKQHDEDLEPGVIETEAVVLFADIKGFSTLSERHSPADILVTLQEYVDIMSNIIYSNGGVIMDYQGDGLMAVFGVDGKADLPAYKAVKAALIMQDAMAEWRRMRRSEYKELFTFSIGISTGKVAFGTLGRRNFRQYVGIGDTVNLAARLQALAKERRSPILICERTNAFVAGKVQTAQLPPVQVKGRFQTCSFYEVCLPGSRKEMPDHGAIADPGQMLVFNRMNLYRELNRSPEV